VGAGERTIGEALPERYVEGRLAAEVGAVPMLRPPLIVERAEASRRANLEDAY